MWFVTISRASLASRQASASFKAFLTIERFKELVYCNGWPLDETPHLYPALLLNAALTFDKASAIIASTKQSQEYVSLKTIMCKI